MRLVDFGLSWQGSSQCNEMRGTVLYMAPEVHECSYHSKADIWSLGVILYEMLSGQLPFQGQNHTEMFNKTSSADFNFNNAAFTRVSDECKDLISKLLVPDPTQRLSGSDALKHPWFKKFKPRTSSFKEDEDFVNERLCNFKSGSSLKMAVMNVLVKMIARDDDEEI